jgi:hypothetical protein
MAVCEGEFAVPLADDRNFSSNLPSSAEKRQFQTIFRLEIGQFSQRDGKKFVLWPDISKLGAKTALMQTLTMRKLIAFESHCLSPASRWLPTMSPSSSLKVTHSCDHEKGLPRTLFCQLRQPAPWNEWRITAIFSDQNPA